MRRFLSRKDPSTISNDFTVRRCPKFGEMRRIASPLVQLVFEFFSPRCCQTDTAHTPRSMVETHPRNDMRDEPLGLQSICSGLIYTQQRVSLLGQGIRSLPTNDLISTLSDIKRG
ncbi:hypothetical protein F9C07_6446 [Aspergillus flavus]|uniref:Uncharacterized protein n=1 Tax=Aspergillus flavus (strain ATCC 200026 / FGSC A1120 / IAM 13836 / NRRL 3357 / JCM 12722 / SRRC 167) TaxID=332952 RepID=A0A7U2MHP5_ASPFN|nr:hypothetical protein F9C07_6446 [Aspergillus flavus]